MRETFSSHHPTICLAYFTAVIVTSVLFTSPACLIVSLAGAFSYAVYLKKMKAVKFMLCVCIPLMIIAAGVNFFFNHHGVTTLFYLNDNPVTKEALVYGAAMAGMVVSAVLWCYCVSIVMTSDKTLYVFGRVLPVISLILSVVLRSIPLFSRKIKDIRMGQKALDTAGAKAGRRQRFRSGIGAFSMMVTWALENSVDTALSMRARGYGLRGRVSYHDLRFDSRDVTLSLVMALIAAGIIAGAVTGYSTIEYYPELLLPEMNIQSILFYCTYLAFCMIPLIVDVREDVKWKYLRSAI
ncbi:MAG: energy-coupling factor transporter transmembrane protein EcfT [Firmicutes bacterium]|nr:energy-coupling factor transporter transmembrane protein EcfT [Bacillota bacterium]